MNVEHVLVNLATMVVGVSLGTYLGAKIMKRELKKEISSYILNELPHVLESQEFRQKMREWFRGLLRELGTIIKEELGLN
jgi:hypothetical protein